MRRGVGLALISLVVLLAGCAPELETEESLERSPASLAAVVSGFTLVNADTDRDLQPLAPGASIDLRVARNLNIRANISGTVGSVRFALDGNASFRTESSAPYALAGDSGGNYVAWTPSAGSHRLTATPYAGAGGTGATGAPVTLTFSVIDSTLPPSPPKTVFPGAEWDERTPASQGVDPARLQAALNVLSSRPGGSAQIAELTIVRNGYLIWKGTGIDNRHPIYSATKTITSTVLGVLATDGVVATSDLVTRHLPSLDDTYTAYGTMTLKHLATMSAGHQGPRGDCWQLHQRGDYDASWTCTQTFTTPGPLQYSPPGSGWAYADPNVHLLGYLLTRKAGQSLESVFKQRIADRIGIPAGSWDWSDYGNRDGYLFNNPAGTPHLASGTLNQVQGGLNISARQLARYGLLYLNRGNWNGQQLLSRSFVDQAGINQVSLSVKRAASFDLRGRYGYYWWTNGVRADGTRPWPAAPADAYTAHGSGRNFVFVIPSWRMVIVRLAPESVPSLDTNHADTTWSAFFSQLAGGVSR